MTRAAILDPKKVMVVASQLYAAGGIASCTRGKLAKIFNVSPPAFTKRYGSFENLIAEVIKDAIRTGNHKVIRWGLAEWRNDARNAPLELKRAAVELMLK
jgi:hypothetical protein